ncbi:MAG: LytR/AlgR family response regulator transcription factor [Candidatus Cyclobacteriaceae bacterium M2_1C_046]
MNRLLSHTLTLEKDLLKYFNVVAILCFIITALSLLQDYLGMLLQNRSYYFSESLSFNLFWLLFVPFCWILFKGLSYSYSRTKPPFYLIINSGLIILLAILQLLVFAVVLLFVLNVLMQEQWDLRYLLIEKFSTRLYLSLAVYLILSIIYYHFRKKQVPHEKTYPDILPVKVGHKTISINKTDISWIASGGSYITLYTSSGNKYVMINSLKNIIEKLDPQHFKRIHRSTIVNTSVVRELRSRMNGDYDVLLIDGTELRLSRNYSKSLKGILL